MNGIKRDREGRGKGLQSVGGKGRAGVVEVVKASGEGR